MWRPIRRTAVMATAMLLTALGGVATAAAPDAPAADADADALIVNGTALNQGQEATVRRIAAEVLPELIGSSAERTDTAALATWWALKEGVLSTANPWAFSLCEPPRNTDILYDCPAPTWQVGVAAVQVPNFDLATVEGTIAQLYPGASQDDVLASAATAAGYPAGTDVHAQVLATGGDLRRSWLMRDGAVGTSLVVENIVPECFGSTTPRSWCFGTLWIESASFAATRPDGERSLEDLRAIFTQIDGSEPPPDDGTVPATVGNTGGVGLTVRTGPSTGTAGLDVLAEGTQVSISCQTRGESVTNEAGYTSDLWDYLPARGGYVADAYMDTGHPDLIPGLDPWDDAPPPPTGGDIVPISQAQGQPTQWVDCGPTSVVTAMLAQGHTPPDWDASYPRAAIETMRASMGGGTGGTNTGDVMAALNALGVPNSSSGDFATLMSQVRDGASVVLGGNTATLPWPTRTNGPVAHFLTVAGYDDGQYLVLDPISTETVVHYVDESVLLDFYNGTGGGGGVAVS